ncbi:MAG: SCP2 sterol-binding domain-containing protein [Actinomycetota bacterium]|nr:SCP2 sterol-binding domain-containing protein [Actinomycetota bacterium]
MSHPFLSPEWIAAAKGIRTKYADKAAKVTTSIRLNGVVTDTPFGAEPLNIALDTSTGTVQLDLGSLDNPDLTITTDYQTAHKIFVEQDQAGAMQAFMGGRIKVQGDMMKLMALQTQMPDDDIAKQISAEINDVTAR